MGRTSSKSLSIHYFGDLPLGPGLGPHHYWPFHRPTASKISIFGQTDEFRPFLHLRSLGLLALPDTRRTDVESGNLTNHNPERELFLLPPEKKPFPAETKLPCDSTMIQVSVRFGPRQLTISLLNYRRLTIIFSTGW